MAKQQYIRTEYADGAVVLSNVRNKRTDENFSLTKVTHLPNGTPLSDDIIPVLSPIYRKDKNGEYFANATFLKDRSIYAKDLGAIGDGVADDTDAIKQGLEIAALTGATFYGVKDGRHRQTYDISIDTLNGGFKWDKNGSELLQFNCSITFHKNSNLPYLSTSLSKNVVKGDTFIQVADITNVEVGDLVNIESPALVTGLIAQSHYYVISYIDTTDGNKLYVENTVVTDTNPQQIIDTGRVGDIVVNFYKMSRGVTIENGYINSDKLATSCIVIQNQNDFYLKDIGVRNARRNGVYIQYCGNNYIENCDSYYHGFAVKDQGYNSVPSSPNGQSYGYGFIHARNAYSEVNNCRGGNGWHTFDAAVGQTYITYNNCSTSKDAFGFSTHEGAWAATYNNCESLGGAGITTRAVYININGGLFKVSNNGSHAIGGNHYQLTVKGATLDMTGVTSGGYMHSSSGRLPILAGAKSEGNISFTSFTGNTIIGHGRAEMFNNDLIIYSNNTLIGTNYALFDSKTVIIKGNTIKGVTAQVLFSIRAENAQIVEVTKNTVLDPIGSYSLSHFIQIVGTGEPITKLEIIGNSVPYFEYLIRFLNAPGQIATRVTDNRGFNKLALGGATNSILVAERNFSPNGLENNTLGGMPEPLNYFRTLGTTAQRPITPPRGFEYFDTTLGRPLWWNTSDWVDFRINASTSIKGLVNQTPAIPNITTPVVTTIEEANTQIQALSTKVNALLTAMRTAGMITP